MEAQVGRYFPYMAMAAAGALGAALGFHLDTLTLRALLLAVFGAVAGGVLALPYEKAVWVLFAYLGFEGMAKIVTKYHPVVHVGADLLVILLTARWIVGWFLQRNQVPRDLPPLLPLFALHFAWYLVQFTNPFSLGILPSLAAAKIYVTMVLLYGYGYYLSSGPGALRAFMALWVLTIAVQSITGLAQVALGPQSVLSISPNYAAPLTKFNASYAFRPFGTTAVPGAPSVYVFLGMSFIVYFLLTARSFIVKSLMAILVPVSILLVLVCQVRASLLKAIVSAALFLLLVLGRGSQRARARILVAVPAVAMGLAFALPMMMDRWIEDQRGIARSLTLFDKKSAMHARVGVEQRILKFAEMVPLGAGLSRTGSAAGVFAKENASDPFFPNGFFTDNFWAATVAEIGIPGSLFITLILLAVLGRGAIAIARTTDPEIRTLQAALICPLIACVLGLWGAEGILYNPEAAFFWFFAGALMRLSRPVESDYST